MRTTLCVVALAMVAGCSAQTTPVGQCYRAAGAFEIAQIGMEGAVQSPLIKPNGKQTIKNVSAKGTQASRACAEAARANDGDQVAFYSSMLTEATRMGREMALQTLKEEAPSE